MLVALLVAVVCASAAPSVWPQPATYTHGDGKLELDDKFAFTATGAKSSTLSRAFQRYSQLLDVHTSRKASHGPSMKNLNVNVSSFNSDLIFGVDESYTIDLPEDSPDGTVTAPTVYGAMRALDTFVQLLAGADDDVHVLPLKITDAPRFPWRGVMIDTARHYYPVSTVKHIIDTMEWNKLNVLHWHVSDDQSFPVKSSKFVDLAGKGSFGPSYVYASADVTGIVEYAQDRGVIVVPEFDMPAHCSSWGAGYPSLMVNCSTPRFTHGDTLNPILNHTYEFVDQLLSEMISLFPSPFIHLGGDEVPTTCWQSEPTITAWMKDHNIADFDDLESYFVSRVASGSGLTSANRTLVYWQEVFQNQVKLPKSAIIEAWKSNVMPDVVKAGHRVTNSYGWYLNHGCNNYGDGVWEAFYSNDPYKWAKGVTPEEQKLIIGGEVTMWSECVDATIFDAIVWPRASAAAEQLWSPATATTNETSARPRIARHRCLLVERGVSAAPIDDSRYPRISPCQ